MQSHTVPCFTYRHAFFIFSVLPICSTNLNFHNYSLLRNGVMRLLNRYSVTQHIPHNVEQFSVINTYSIMLTRINELIQQSHRPLAEKHCISQERSEKANHKLWKLVTAHPDSVRDFIPPATKFNCCIIWANTWVWSLCSSRPCLRSAW